MLRSGSLSPGKFESLTSPGRQGQNYNINVFGICTVDENGEK